MSSFEKVESQVKDSKEIIQAIRKLKNSFKQIEKSFDNIKPKDNSLNTTFVTETKLESEERSGWYLMSSIKPAKHFDWKDSLNIESNFTSKINRTKLKKYKRTKREVNHEKFKTKEKQYKNKQRLSEEKKRWQSFDSQKKHNDSFQMDSLANQLDLDFPKESFSSEEISGEGNEKIFTTPKRKVIRNKSRQPQYALQKEMFSGVDRLINQRKLTGRDHFFSFLRNKTMKNKPILKNKKENYVNFNEALEKHGKLKENLPKENPKWTESNTEEFLEKEETKGSIVINQKLQKEDPLALKLVSYSN